MCKILACDWPRGGRRPTTGPVGGSGINTAGDVELVTRDEGNHSKIVTTEFRRIRSTKTVSKEYSRQKSIRTPHAAVL